MKGAKGWGLVLSGGTGMGLLAAFDHGAGMSGHAVAVTVLTVVAVLVVAGVVLAIVGGRR